MPHIDCGLWYGPVCSKQIEHDSGAYRQLLLLFLVLCVDKFAEFLVVATLLIFFDTLVGCNLCHMCGVCVCVVMCGVCVCVAGACDNAVVQCTRGSFQSILRNSWYVPSLSQPLLLFPLSSLFLALFLSLLSLPLPSLSVLFACMCMCL